MTKPKPARSWKSVEKQAQHNAPPHSVEGEQGVLGSMFISPLETIPEVAGRINEKYFYIPCHQEIYNELVALFNKGEAIDLITFTQHFRDINRLDSVGGASFITSLFTFVPTAANVGYYLDIVIDKYILRQIIATSTEAVRSAFEEQSEVNVLLADVQTKIMSISGPTIKEPQSLHEAIMEKIERMENGEPDADIIKTRITRLDEVSPLRKGDMPLLSGIKKSGKSILALSILENICICEKKPGIYFSLEDRTAKVMDRIFAGVSRIPMNRHHSSKLSPEEINKSMKAAEKIKESGLIIRDDCYDLSSIVSVFRKALQKFPNLCIACVDYAQLCRPNLEKGETREREVATVSRTFRLLAMETGVPILLVSQLNKDGFARESMALEQDATASWKIGNSDEPGKKTISIEWQRNGESGVFVPITFRGEIARVEGYVAAKEDF